MTLTETQAWGNYTATCDDRANRWYINRTGQPIDHKGLGFATKHEALKHLVKSLCSGDSLPRAGYANLQDDIHKPGGRNKNRIKTQARGSRSPWHNPMISRGHRPAGN
jgi:hypothetical protein